MKINIKTNINNILSSINSSTFFNKGSSIYSFSSYKYLGQEKKGQITFDFSLYYKKHKSYLPNNILPSDKFLTWFIGFSESKGSFVLNNRGDLAFIITQNTSEIKVLHFIEETLGFGKVIKQSSTTGRYVIQSKKEIEVLISIFNGNTVLPSKQKRLNSFINGFNLWVTKGTIRLEPVITKNNSLLPNLNNSWLAGFTDGEGYFTCSIGERGYSFNYNVSQIGEINVKILKELCLLFKGGLVSNHSVKNVYEYRIAGVKCSKNIFPYFDRYTLFTKKCMSYILWKQIHEDLVKNHHLDPVKKLEMIEKARMINK